MRKLNTVEQLREEMIKLSTLSVAELRLILEKLEPKGGWSDDPEIGKLQAKLSIMLELAARREGLIPRKES